MLNQMVHDVWVVSNTGNQIKTNHAYSILVLLKETVELAWPLRFPHAERMLRFRGSVILTAQCTLPLRFWRCGFRVLSTPGCGTFLDLLHDVRYHYFTRWVGSSTIEVVLECHDRGHHHSENRKNPIIDFPILYDPLRSYSYRIIYLLQLRNSLHLYLRHGFFALSVSLVVLPLFLYDLLLELRLLLSFL